MGTSAFSLPIRRREQLRRVLNGESVRDASLAVGYKNENSGNVALSDTRKRVMAAMEHCQLTPIVMVRDYLLPLLNATKTEFAKFEGKITDTLEVEDNTTRRETLHMALKLAGAYPVETDSSGVKVAVQVNIGGINGDSTDE